MPISLDWKRVSQNASMAATKSTKEVFQKRQKILGGDKIDHTAVTTIAARVALGIQKSAGLSSKMESTTTPPATMAYAGDLTPVEEFTAVRDIAPPTAIDEKKLLKKFVTPRYTSSCAGSMIYPFLRANAFAIARCSITPAMKGATARGNTFENSALGGILGALIPFDCSMVSNFLLESSQGINNTYLNFAQFPHRIVIFQVDVFVYTV
jgi:hypothetical protein